MYCLSHWIINVNPCGPTLSLAEVHETVINDDRVIQVLNPDSSRKV
jgi:hypothetical protein